MSPPLNTALPRLTLLEAALAQCQDAIFLEDDQRRFVYVNGAACRLLGYSEDELLAMGPPDIDPHVTWPQLLAGTWAAGDRRGFHTHHRTRSGQLIPVDVNGTCLSVAGRLYFVSMARNVSEREAHQTELKRRDRQLQAILDVFPFLVWWKDPQGVIQVANRESARWANLEEASALIGKTDFDLVPEDWAASYAEGDQRVISSGQVLCEEEFHPDFPGGAKWTETWRSPLHLDGDLLGTVGFSRDITDRKQTEHDLQQILALLQGVIDAFPDVLFEVSREGRYLNVWTKNPELLAASREQLLGRCLDDVLSPESAAIGRSALEEAALTGQSFGKVIRIDTPSGTRWFELSVSRMASPDNHDPHLITVSRDVTARMELQAALAREEHKYRSLVEHSPDATARFDPQLKCLYANPAMADQMDRLPDALVGLRPSEFIGTQAGEVLESALASVFASAERSTLELHWHNARGQTVCSMVTLSPEFDAANTVVSVLAVGRDISELRAYQDKIHQMAFYDPLTGLANRVLFNDRLTQMIAEASWHQHVAGVMIVDMDRFKQINDTLGHAAGDELLREAAHRLRDSVRGYDTVARLGGDEFGVLLPQVRDTESLGRVVQKVQAAFDRSFALTGRDVIVSCSIGISVFPQDGTDSDELVRHADSAMYSAKRLGRNGFRFYSKDLTATAQERLTLEQGLRRALERNELTLHYQPKVALHSGVVQGSEALLRWCNPVLGNVPPNQFIPVAEDAGLIVDIGAWVLQQACRAAAEWNAPHQPVHKVAVNLSARQLQTPGLLPHLAQTLVDTGCQAAWIELEITESLLLDEDGRVLQTLEALRSMGFTIAIDDFGTGYSALSYLARFPIDTLKIDRSFIQSVTTDRYRAELVRAILSIARCLNQQVVAEGVETLEQAEFLLAHGCELAQGYLYSRPLPQADMAPRVGAVLTPPG